MKLKEFLRKSLGYFNTIKVCHIDEWNTKDKNITLSEVDDEDDLPTDILERNVVKWHAYAFGDKCLLKVYVDGAYEVVTKTNIGD